VERRYTTSEAAGFIGVKPKTLRNIISSQRRDVETGHAFLAYEYVGRRPVFRESVLRAWMEEEHRRGVRHERGRKQFPELSDEEKQGRFRCERCGRGFDWKHQLWKHDWYRKNKGRCLRPSRRKKPRASECEPKRKRVKMKSSRSKPHHSKRSKTLDRRQGDPRKWRRPPMTVAHGEEDDYLDST